MADNFTISKKGYNIEEVDNYISRLEEIIMSYKGKDAAIKNALVSAQISADNIIRNAEVEAQRIRQSITNHVKEANVSILMQRESLREFQDSYNELIAKYVHQFNEQDIQNVIGKIDKAEGYMSRLQRNVTPGLENRMRNGL